jgi:hypothetical protein
MLERNTEPSLDCEEPEGSFGGIKTHASDQSAKAYH